MRESHPLLPAFRDRQVSGDDLSLSHQQGRDQFIEVIDQDQDRLQSQGVSAGGSQFTLPDQRGSSPGEVSFRRPRREDTELVPFPDRIEVSFFIMGLLDRDDRNRLYFVPGGSLSFLFPATTKDNDDRRQNHGEEII